MAVRHARRDALSRVLMICGDGGDSGVDGCGKEWQGGTVDFAEGARTCVCVGCMVCPRPLPFLSSAISSLSSYG